ncbi:MAG: hypothetical protein WDW36_005026 [Sanguina aurantia]
MTPNRSGGGTSTPQGSSRGARHSTPAAQGSSSAKELLQPLYSLALELRDRLSFSQQIIAGLKADLAASQTVVAQERAAAAGQLEGFKEEVARLSYEGHTTQNAADDACRKMASLAAENLQIQVHADKEIQARIQENEDVRDQAVAASTAWQQEMTEQGNVMSGVVAGLEEQLRESGERVEDLEAELEEAQAHGDLLRGDADAARAAADDATAWAQMNEARHVEALAALSALKSRLADLQRTEGLFLAGRDKISRLSKEVMELKEMVVEGAAQLGASSILDANADPDSLSAPLLLHALHPHARPASRDRGRSMGRDPQASYRDPRSTHRDTRSSSPGPRYSQQASGYGSGSSSRDGSYAVASLPQLAFLGPLSADYPPDPEGYTMERVGGGFSPREGVPLTQPRASGWVPSAVVRLAQAFRHSYSLTDPAWTAWEPLLLMVDEVYRSRTASVVHSVKAAAKEKNKTLRRQLASSASYPSVMATQRVFGMQKQPGHVQGSGGPGERGEGGRRELTKATGKRDYHVGNQLNEAIEENNILRRAMVELAPLPHPPVGVFLTGGSPCRTSHPPPPAGSGYRRRG